MKNIILNIGKILTVIIVFFMMIGARYSSPAQNSSIIGTWISDQDSNWKLVFSNANNSNKCYNYYEGVLTRTTLYSISNTTPQCGAIVPVEASTSYLQLTNIQNVNDKICYEINGITSQKLSLRVIDKGGAMVFTRQ